MDLLELRTEESTNFAEGTIETTTSAERSKWNSGKATTVSNLATPPNSVVISLSKCIEHSSWLAFAALIAKAVAFSRLAKAVTSPAVNSSDGGQGQI